MISEYDVIDECWKSIPGFDDYEVSDHGRIKSYVGKTPIKRISNCGRIFPISVSSHGYAITHLNRDGKSYFKYVHRLVLEAFVGTLIDSNTCHHKDGNKLNNHLSNLQWTNQSVNIKAAYDQKMRIPNGPKKLKDGEIWLLKRLLNANIRNRIIRKMFDLDSATVSHVKAGRRWRYAGESI